MAAPSDTFSVWVEHEGNHYQSLWGHSETLGMGSAECTESVSWWTVLQMCLGEARIKAAGERGLNSSVSAGCLKDHTLFFPIHKMPFNNKPRQKHLVPFSFLWV